MGHAVTDMLLTCLENHFGRKSNLNYGEITSGLQVTVLSLQEALVLIWLKIVLKIIINLQAKKQINQKNLR